MTGKITLSELEQYLSKAAWILKGPVDASDFKVYIFPLLFFKRISDVYDEEYRQALEESGGDKEYAELPEFHRFIIPEGCHWKDVRETTVNIGATLEKAFREIEQQNQEYLYGIFGDAQWSNKNKLPDSLLLAKKPQILLPHKDFWGEMGSFHQLLQYQYPQNIHLNLHYKT